MAMAIEHCTHIVQELHISYNLHTSHTNSILRYSIPKRYKKVAAQLIQQLQD